MQDEKERNIIVRIMPSGEELDIELPADTTVAELIEGILDNGVADRTDARGAPIQYDLFKLDNGGKLPEEKTMLDLAVKEGAVIIMAPRLAVRGDKVDADNVAGHYQLSVQKQDEDKVNIGIRFMPVGEEVTVEVSRNVGVQEIFDFIFDHELAPRNDPFGNPFKYSLVFAKTNVLLDPAAALGDYSPEDDDLLYCIPVLNAGGGSGLLVYELPEKLQLGQKAQAQVRIGRSEMAEHLLREGLSDDATLGEIEINDLMIVTLTENAVQEHLQIRSLSTEEQVLGDHFYSQWVFDLTPMRLGFTALILRISLVVMLEGFGERRKDVFLLSQDLEITPAESKDGFHFFRSARELYDWTPEFRSEIYGYLARNETGLALTKLTNFFQRSDLELLNAMIMLQAQWNEGKNKQLLNLISQNEWMMIQSRVNYSILELIKNIENGQLDVAENRRVMEQLGQAMA